MSSVTVVDCDEINIVGLDCDAKLGEEGVIWNGRLITPIKGHYDPTLPEVILCSKKGKKNHGKAAMGFVKMAAGAAIFFLPLPGARPLGITIALKGALEVGSEVGNAEIENSQNPPDVQVSIGTSF